MVNTQLAFSVLQLVALSLPAFAILLQLVVESETAYTYWAVPVTTLGMVLFLAAGALILGELLLTTPSALAQIALGILLFGILTLIIGAVLLGYQTGKKQRRLQDSN